MHQIQFRLGLRPKPHWGSLERFLGPSSWIQEMLLSRGMDTRKEKRKRKKQQWRR